MRRLLFVAIAVPLAILLVRAWRVGIAGDWLDPVAHISAQDEALYAHGALQMATRGDWLTPRFLDRYALYKPPLYMWLAAASAKLLGLSRFTLRLPLALVSCLTPLFVFFIAARIRAPLAGLAAALLIAADYLWAVPSAMVLSDPLLATAEAGAMSCLFFDPQLRSRRAFWGFAGAIAAAILTKTIAGVAPLGAFGLYWILAPERRRPSFGRACAVVLAALALAAPWFAYQLIVHFRWFWDEHIVTEIWGFGAGVTDQQTTHEGQASFYLLRLVKLEPVLSALFLAAIPGLVAAAYRREREAVWLVCWLAPVVAAPILWTYRNDTYLIPCIAPMAVAATCYWPWRVRPVGVLAIAAAGLVAGLLFPSATWGISLKGGTTQIAAPAAERYCEMQRGNELISVGMKDDLYASVLPLPRLRYAIVGSSMTGGQYVKLDFAAMGISVPPEQFNHLEQYRAGFEAALRAADYKSGDPIGTLIVAPDRASLLTIVPAHPLSDFLFPGEYRGLVESAGFTQHYVEDAGSDLFYLLSRTKLPRGPLPWPCQM